MALLSLGESRWRMLRRVIKKKQFKYEDARGMTRADQTHFDWLLTNGFFAVAEKGLYTMTDRGRAAADLGEFELEPEADATPPKRRANPRT